MTNHFTYEEVLKLDSIQNKKIKTVNAHYWVNLSDSANHIKVLDTLEIVFNDASFLAFSGRTDSCLKLVTPSVSEDITMLSEQFKGQIVLQCEDLIDLDLWCDVGDLEHISLRNGAEGHYLNDAVLMCFENKEIIIYFDGDSVEMEEVFEEIDEE